MEKGNTIQNAIIYVNYLNVTDISFHYSIGGSVLMLSNKGTVFNDIDIIAVHATPDKSGKAEWIYNNLKKVGFGKGNSKLHLKTGLNNKNFHIKKRDITLHIIIID